MNRISNYVYTHRILTAAVVFAALAIFLNVGSSGSQTVYANCGANTSIHGYGGAIIDVRGVKYGSTGWQSVNNPVRVETINPTNTPEGNIVRLGAGPEGVVERRMSAEFNQIGNNCVPGFDGNSVVFGYGTTSQPVSGSSGSWALDCDYTLRMNTANKYQTFSVTGLGTPNGFRAVTATDIANGYGWNTKTIAPINGGTIYTAVTYYEPPPPPPTTTYSHMYNLQNDAYNDCKQLRGYALVRNNNNGTNLASKYRISWAPNPADPGNRVSLSANFLDTGINGSTGADRYRFHFDLTESQSRSIFDKGKITSLRLHVQSIPPTLIPAETRDFMVEGRNCYDTPIPNFSVTPACGSFVVTNLTEPDMPTSTVRYDYEVYERGSAASGYVRGNLVASGTGSNIGTFPVNVSMPESNNVNEGFIVVVTVQGRYASGDPAGDPVVREANTGPCYAATCTINSVTKTNPATPDVAGGVQYAVVGGANYRVNVTLTNTGSQIARTDFSATYNVVGTSSYTKNISPGTGTVGTGSAVGVEFDVTVPDSVSSARIYPDYYGKFRMGPDCGYLNVYKRFDITPTNGGIQLLPDRENPTSVQFTGSAAKQTPTETVPNVSVVSRIYLNGATHATSNTAFTHNFGSSVILPPLTASAAPGANDYCGDVTVNPATGWIGPNSHIAGGQPKTSEPRGCTQPVNLPYMKVYGGDVVSGAATLNSTSGSCVSPTPASGLGGIAAFMRPAAENAAAGKSGSGSQYATFSYGGTTNGFASAMLRGTAPAASGVNKLTFANTVSPIGAGLSPELGPQFNGSRPCLDDYFTKGQYSNTNDSNSVISESNVTSLSLAGLAFNKQTLISYPDSSVSADVTLSGGDGYASRHAVFVDGDVRISTNIVYAAETSTSTTSGDVRDRPSFTLIARGNIYIDPGVSRLDGTYIAQKRADSATDTGKIYTCAPNGQPITSSDSTQRFSACGANGGVPQLRVYGSFVADQLVLGRTLGSVRDSVFQENQDTTKAAEVFIFMPDYYISKPVVRPSGTITSGDYEYLAKLPPIL